ncbi:MAG: RagB/SusD family nutrient uptake outer membrane protein [Fulvivirga sp.]
MMKNIKLLFIAICFLAVTSCEDYIDEQPVDSIGDDIVIEDLESLNAAVLGMYSSMQVGNQYGELQVFMPGILSDEMEFTGTFPTKADMAVNNLTAENGTMRGVWSSPYLTIFIANTILERAENAGDASEIASFIAEAKFGRALALFNLVKLWGGVPMPLTSDVSANSALGRTSEAEVYAQIITDLTDAVAALPTKADNGVARATRGAANALLARAHLYSGNLSAAGTAANAVITSGEYSIDPDYANIFDQTASSPERIFEIFASNQDQSNLGFFAQPTGLGGRYDYAPSRAFYAEIDDADERKALIVPNTADAAFAGFFVTDKYTDGPNGTDRAQAIRLAEMYLIRAQANQDVADLNILRTRAGLAPLGAYSDAAIYFERKVELAFEGHRWFDLRRSGTIDAVMSAVKPASWNPTDVLLPIPQRELEQNPTLGPSDQNPGY